MLVISILFKILNADKIKIFRSTNVLNTMRDERKNIVNSIIDKCSKT